MIESNPNDLNNDLEKSPDTEVAMFGLGCFWGAERLFWQCAGVINTAVGYAGGHTENPDYAEVCSGTTGHCEVVKITFDPKKVSYPDLLKLFWEAHDPTQGMRQGNDVGSQYRSVIYAFNPAQLSQALKSRDQYQILLDQAGLSRITTEIKMAPTFFHAENHHQHYLAKNPNGYCGLKGTGINFDKHAQ